ncbi:hypothetical protein [Undibacterium sp. Ren11W]|uniref:hypothetical protein n=1 Tax=Undibacterium sp. Ren11W TaxID=3413045 RepID=UPI003BEF5ECC
MTPTGGAITANGVSMQVSGGMVFISLFYEIVFIFYWNSSSGQEYFKENHAFSRFLPKLIGDVLADGKVLPWVLS